MANLGLDIGYSNLKSAVGETDHEPELLLRPAGAVPAAVMSANWMGEDDESVHVLVEGEEYIACVDPTKIPRFNRALYDDYPNTKLYRALFHAALVLSGEESLDELVTGLPVHQFKDPAYRAALQQWMSGVHQVTPRMTVEVKKVRVVPQPAGAFMAYAVDEGMLDDLREMRTLVADPGFFSFDWVLMEGHQPREDCADTSLEAMSRVLERAGQLIGKDYGSRLEAQYLERALRNGRDTIRVHNRPVEITPYLEQAIEDLSESLIHAVRTSLRHLNADVDLILMAGGGGRLYEPVMRRAFPKADVYVPEKSPVFNALGFFRFAGDA